MYYSPIFKDNVVYEIEGADLNNILQALWAAAESTDQWTDRRDIANRTLAILERGCEPVSGDE